MYLQRSVAVGSTAATPLRCMKPLVEVNKLQKKKYIGHWLSLCYVLYVNYSDVKNRKEFCVKNIGISLHFCIVRVFVTNLFTTRQLLWFDSWLIPQLTIMCLFNTFKNTSYTSNNCNNFSALYKTSLVHSGDGSRPGMWTLIWGFASDDDLWWWRCPIMLAHNLSIAPYRIQTLAMEDYINCYKRDKTRNQSGGRYSGWLIHTIAGLFYTRHTVHLTFLSHTVMVSIADI